MAIKAKFSWQELTYLMKWNRVEQQTQGKKMRKLHMAETVSILANSGKLRQRSVENLSSARKRSNVDNSRQTCGLRAGGQPGSIRSLLNHKPTD